MSTYIIRRQFIHVAIATISTPTIAAISSGNGNNAAPRDPPISNYLFWMDDRTRAEIRMAATDVASRIGSFVEHGLQSDLQSLYAESDIQFRNRWSISEFEERLLNTRRRMGVPLERAYQGAEGGFRKLPNLQNGKYSIAIFDLLFSDGESFFTEQLTFSIASDRYLLSGYYFGPKPFVGD